MKNYSVGYEDLKSYEQKIFQAVGLGEKEADAVAELLVHADLRRRRTRQ